MSYTQQQAQKLIDLHTEDDSISADLSSFIESNFEGFQQQFLTLYDVVDALELDDDADAWNWVRQELAENEDQILEES